jgi:predicted MFS family arabinose efflux permease
MSTRPHSAPEDPAPRSAWSIISVLALTVFVTTSNGASLGAFIPQLAADLEAGVPLLGQVTTAVFLVSAVVSLMAGPVADYYGKRRIILYGLLILAVSAGGTSLAPSYGWFLAARLLSAFSSGFIVGNTLALTGTLFGGEERRRALSWVTAGTASAPIAGVPLLALLASFGSWRGAYAAVSLMVLLLVRALVPDDTQRPTNRFSTAAFLSAYQPLLRSRPMLRIYSASALRATSWVGLLTYLGAFLGETLELGVREIGWGYMLGGVGYFVGTKLAGARLGGIDLRLLYGVATLLMGALLGLAFMLPSSGVQIAAALTLAAAFSGIGWVTLVTLMSSETPAGQASTMSLNAVLFALGSGLGGLVGGGLLAFGGYGALGIGLLLFSAASGFLIWHPLALVRHLRTRRPAAQPPA